MNNNHVKTENLLELPIVSRYESIIMYNVYNGLGNN